MIITIGQKFLWFIKLMKSFSDPFNKILFYEIDIFYYKIIWKQD